MVMAGHTGNLLETISEYAQNVPPAAQLNGHESLLSCIRRKYSMWHLGEPGIKIAL